MERGDANKIVSSDRQTSHVLLKMNLIRLQQIREGTLASNVASDLLSTKSKIRDEKANLKSSNPGILLQRNLVLF